MSMQPKSQSELQPQPQLRMDLSIDLSLFCQSVRSNFFLIWDRLNKQAEQIEELKKLEYVGNDQNPEKNVIQSGTRNSNRNNIANNSLTYSEGSQWEKQPIMESGKANEDNGFIREKTPQEVKEIGQQPQLPVQTKKEEVSVKKNQNKLLQDLAKNVRPVQRQMPKQAKVDLNKPVNEAQNLLAQTRLQNIEMIDEKPQTQTVTPNNEYLTMMENKILEMNDRLQKIELASIKESGNFSKKMNQLYLQLQKNTDALNKKQSQLKKLQFLIDKLRGQLSEYKLKKQSQLMRMANNPTTGSSSNKEYNEFLIEKIQEITNCLPEFVLKSDFEDYRMEMKMILSKLERRVGDSVSNEEFQGLVAILSRKKTDNGAAVVKINRQASVKDKTGQKDNKIEDIDIDDVDPIVQLKLISLQKQLKQLKQEAEQSRVSTQHKINKNFQALSQINSKLAQVSNQLTRNQHKSSQYQQFMKNMNDSYNEKFKEIINQIAQTQQSVEKLNNQMKFYSFTNSNKSESQIGPTSHSSGVIADGKIIDMENDVSLLKKKVNKLTLKLQSFKEDLLAFRQDFAREQDGIKSMMEKKCDWQSLKKGMHYFEERVKEIANYVQILQKSMTEVEDNGQSTAAKKGWTCLCCDKDIKQYEGKLGQAKFTSIFPSRYESPRIGGYFKQKQANKEYSQLFLKHNRRLSQNHTKSKDQIA